MGVKIKYSLLLYSLLAIHVFFLTYLISQELPPPPAGLVIGVGQNCEFSSLSNQFQMKYAEINAENPNNYITKRTNLCLWLRRTVNKWLLFSQFIPLTKQNLKRTCETIKIKNRSNGLHKYMLIKLVLWLCKLYLCKSN